MNFIDLFAGIGGFRRGMELAGHKCVGFCEWDKFATASYTSMHLITPEQREKLAEMPLKQRQKEILKHEYRNGEWYAADIRNVHAADMPTADCWCFGAPCQDFSIAGLRAGLDGDRSGLVREVFRLLEELQEEDRPEWLIYENVKGMLNSNRGFDFLAILLEMERGGYDVQWQLLNTRYHGIPQNRERVYVVGHLRRYGPAKVFPVTGAGRENCADIKQIGKLKSLRNNKNQYRVYDDIGISPTLNKMDGGGREPHIAVKAFGIEPKQKDIGVVWYDKYNCNIAIRKLTPRECFRLQGWTDDYFEKAKFVNSDSQLYKQAGNGVTVAAVECIARKLKINIPKDEKSEKGANFEK